MRICEKQIKECIRKCKVQDQEEDEKKEMIHAQQNLIAIQGRKDMLENVVIKPTLEGRKTIGNLEIHSNGIRYASSKGLKVDITFSNIKHAFFQPCQ